MSKVLELREKRAKAWEAAKKFLDAKRTADGFVSVEDAAAYDRMEADVVNLGKEIERLERQATIDAELARATSKPITNQPNGRIDGETKTGRASDEYKRAFWNGMRNRISYCQRHPELHRRSRGCGCGCGKQDQILPAFLSAG